MTEKTGTMIYGYMRVSSIDQNEDRQRIDLMAYGIPPGDIFMDKLSGKDFHRPQYQRLRKRLKKGDVLVVKSIDRLGRNYDAILAEWRYLVKTRGADIVILDMPLLDTRARDENDLTRTLISDIVLQLLSYVAQTERENIRKRQAEGIAAARKRGVRFGPKPRPLPEGFAEIYGGWRDKRLSVAQALEKTGFTRGQFYWAVSRVRAETEKSPAGKSCRAGS